MSEKTNKNKRQNNKPQLYLGQDTAPPSATEIEEVVLGTILLEPFSLNRISADLTPELFYKMENQIICRAIIKMYSDNSSIDILTLTQYLKKTNELDVVGGAYYISTLTSRVGASSHLEFHVKILQQKSLERLLMVMCSQTIQNIASQSDDVFDVYAKLQSEIDAAIKNLAKFEISMIDKVNEKVIREAVRVLEKGEKSGVPSGLTLVDGMTNGWQKSDLIILAGRPAMGKCLCVNELVITNVGNISIGNIKVGQNILGTDGNEYQVTGVFPQGQKDVFRVHFDDYTYVDCCEEHLWKVSSRAERKASYGKKEIKSSVLTTKKMISSGIILKDGRCNYSIEFVKPLNFRAKSVLLNPYLLGFYLGDGYASDGSCYVSNTESDLLKKINIYLADINCTLKSVGNGKDYRINKIIKKGKYINDYLKELGLVGKKSHEKFIPKKYLYNTIDVRVNLLQGLVDADGYLPTSNRSQIEYSTTSEQLRDNILELVRGLGGKATYLEKQGAYTTKNGEKIFVKKYYRMYLSLPPEIVPVSSKKHLAKYSTVKRFHRKFITKIEPLDKKEEMVCISVNSPDNCFITTGYNATHNTSVALCLALKPAIEMNVPALFFSLEMSKEQLAGRIQSYYSEVDVSRVITKNLTFEEILHVENSTRILDGKPFYIDDTPALSLFEFKAKARKMKREKGVRIIFIDYLQLMRSGLNLQNREQEVAEISKGLKAMAKELDLPIIALSQLSRGADNRSDKKPLLSDLRESGSIEQDADMVIFTYRPEYYGIESYVVNNSEMSSRGLMMLLVEKHRNGAVGEIPLSFIGQYTKVIDLKDDGIGSVNAQFISSNTLNVDEKPLVTKSTAIEPNKEDFPF